MLTEFIQKPKKKGLTINVEKKKNYRNSENLIVQMQLEGINIELVDKYL